MMNKRDVGQLLCAEKLCNVSCNTKSYTSNCKSLAD